MTEADCYQPLTREEILSPNYTGVEFVFDGGTITQQHAVHLAKDVINALPVARAVMAASAAALLESDLTGPQAIDAIQILNTFAHTYTSAMRAAMNLLKKEAVDAPELPRPNTATISSPIVDFFSHLKALGVNAHHTPNAAYYRLCLDDEHPADSLMNLTISIHDTVGQYPASITMRTGYLKKLVNTHRVDAARRELKDLLEHLLNEHRTVEEFDAFIQIWEGYRHPTAAIIQPLAIAHLVVDEHTSLVVDPEINLHLMMLAPVGVFRSFIRNTIVNARTHGSRKETIAIRSGTDEEGPYLDVQVSDETGVGFTDDEIINAFRVTKSSRTGAGVSMYVIARKIRERGGNVVPSNDYDKNGTIVGSTVTARFPCV